MSYDSCPLMMLLIIRVGVGARICTDWTTKIGIYSSVSLLIRQIAVRLGGNIVVIHGDGLCLSFLANWALFVDLGLLDDMLIDERTEWLWRTSFHKRPSVCDLTNTMQRPLTTLFGLTGMFIRKSLQHPNSYWVTTGPLCTIRVNSFAATLWAFPSRSDHKTYDVTESFGSPVCSLSYNVCICICSVNCCRSECSGWKFYEAVVPELSSQENADPKHISY